MTLLLSRESHLRLNGLYEVIGKVVSLQGGGAGGELGVRVLGATEWSGQVDMAGYEAVVDATHRFKEIFYEGGNGNGGGGGGGGDRVMY